jgi:hypothetical protein
MVQPRPHDNEYCGCIDEAHIEHPEAAAELHFEAASNKHRPVFDDGALSRQSGTIEDFHY